MRKLLSLGGLLAVLATVALASPRDKPGPPPPPTPALSCSVTWNATQQRWEIEPCDCTCPMGYAPAIPQYPGCYEGQLVKIPCEFVGPPPPAPALRDVKKIPPTAYCTWRFRDTTQPNWQKVDGSCDCPSGSDSSPPTVQEVPCPVDGQTYETPCKFVGPPPPLRLESVPQPMPSAR